MRNSGNGARELFSRLAAEKKKTVTALCLVTVMVLMWIRLLGGEAPETTKAALLEQEVMSGQSGSELKISFIELPNVKGRNDVLTRDFFTADGWQGFVKDGERTNSAPIKEVDVAPDDDSEEVIRRVADKLRLEAIVLGKNRQAFINDKLLSVGDKLLIRDGVDTYECEVAGIEKNAVFVRCGGSEITLKLMAIEVVD